LSRARGGASDAARCAAALPRTPPPAPARPQPALPPKSATRHAAALGGPCRARKLTWRAVKGPRNCHDTTPQPCPAGQPRGGRPARRGSSGRAIKQWPAAGPQAHAKAPMHAWERRMRAREAGASPSQAIPPPVNPTPGQTPRRRRRRRRRSTGSKKSVKRAPSAGGSRQVGREGGLHSLCRGPLGQALRFWWGCLFVLFVLGVGVNDSPAAEGSSLPPKRRARCSLFGGAVGVVGLPEVGSAGRVRDSAVADRAGWHLVSRYIPIRLPQGPRRRHKRPGPPGAPAPRPAKAAPSPSGQSPPRSSPLPAPGPCRLKRQSVRQPPFPLQNPKPKPQTPSPPGPSATNPARHEIQNPHRGGHSPRPCKANPVFQPRIEAAGLGP
jgi:hypothetical protein